MNVITAVKSRNLPKCVTPSNNRRAACLAGSAFGRLDGFDRGGTTIFGGLASAPDPGLARPSSIVLAASMTLAK